MTFAKAYSGLNDQEINQLDRWIRRNTVQRFGPVRSVKAEQVFEIGFEGSMPPAATNQASPCAFRASCAGARTNPPMKPTPCKQLRRCCSDDNLAADRGMV